MKNNILLLFIFFYNYLLYAQQDTIIINKSDIIPIEQDIYTQDPRTGSYRTRYYAQKGSIDSLNGFYKVIEDETHFYTCHFQRGIKSLNKEPYYNFVKYYKKNKETSTYQVYKIDLYFPYFFANRIYYTTDSFDCREKKMKINQLNIWSEQIERTFYIKQRIKGENIEWIFYKYMKGIIPFSKKNVCN